MTYTITSSWGDGGLDFRAIIAVGLTLDQAREQRDVLQSKRSYIHYVICEDGTVDPALVARTRKIIHRCVRLNAYSRAELLDRIRIYNALSR